PAFRAARGPERQRQGLNDIRAVLPPAETKAAAVVFAALQDERLIPHAMRVLDEMPLDTQQLVFTRSQAFR
ncbi:hypothetical protein, partial [Klebsiella oxytoca]